ncbi:MAG: type II toxin-antitoxin system YafQ family toxin [Eubacterium sp.]|jgi:mRNA interferase YafQ|nr:type II toxin-antitoxin system YafQ family toxin [Eubacterium sp.]
MLKIVPSNRFKKDLKRAQKRGCKMEHLRDVIHTLASGHTLNEKYCDHELSGNYKGFHECHIEPDWLLIYRITQDELALFLFRTGTHSDLF